MRGNLIINAAIMESIGFTKIINMKLTFQKILSLSKLVKNKGFLNIFLF